MVRVFLGIFMLLAVGSAGVAGYLFMSQQKQEQSTPAAPAAFVNIEPIQLALTAGGVTDMRTYYLTVETREGDPQRLVVQEQKKLRDRYMIYLSALSTRAGPENLENVDYVKAQLKLASDEALGKNVVYGILIRNVLTRP